MSLSIGLCFMLQPTWTFWHGCRWSTRRCPAGAAAQRLLGAMRSCRHRPRATFNSSRTSCKYQVCLEALYSNEGAKLNRPFCCQTCHSHLVYSLVSVKWVGVGKSRECIIKLFWSARRPALLSCADYDVRCRYIYQGDLNSSQEYSATARLFVKL